MYFKYTIPELKEKISKIQSYLGPLIEFDSDMIVIYQDRLVFEYLCELKHEYYKRRKQSERMKKL